VVHRKQLSKDLADVAVTGNKTMELRGGRVSREGPVVDTPMHKMPMELMRCINGKAPVVDTPMHVMPMELMRCLNGQCDADFQQRERTVKEKHDCPLFGWVVVYGFCGCKREGTISVKE
jgi:hypothetical protein